MSGWRAVLRLAVRDAVRGRGRSLLVALMVLVPVALTTVGVVVARSSQLDPQDLVQVRLGSGAVQARVFGGFEGLPTPQDVTAQSGVAIGQGTPLPDAEVERRLQAVVGPRDRLVPTVYGGQRSLVVGDRVYRTDVGELDLAALGEGAPVTLASGRLPAADDEVLAWARNAAPSFGIGDRFTAVGGGPDRDLVVVGTFRATDPLGLASLLGRPGAGLGPRSTTGVPVNDGYGRGWFVVGPDPVSWAQVQQVNAFGGMVLSRAAVAEDPAVDPSLVGDYGPDSTEIVTTAVLLALTLLQVMLMVGPAVAVGARRNERLLAVVAASGGAPRHLAGAVVAGAAVVGLAAGVLGAGLGAGAGAVLVRTLDTRDPGRMPRVDLHVGDLVGLVLVGMLTAAVAALLPALRVARLDVVASLTGRRAQTAPRLHVPLLGLGLLAAGTGAAWWGSGRRDQIVLVLGIAVGEIGLVLATSAVVAGFARLAGRLPLSARLALRDAARQRSRTVPAVAATIAAVAAATAVGVLGASQLQAARQAYRPQAAAGTLTVQLVGLPDTAVPANAQRIAAALRDVLGATAPGTVYAAKDEPDGSSSYLGIRLPEQCTPGQGCSGTVLNTVFADPETAAILAPDGEQARAALEAGSAVVWDRVVIDRDGRVPVTLSSYDGSPDRVVRLPAVLADGPALDAAILPRSAAAALGVTLAPQALVVPAAQAGSAADQARLDLALARIDPDLSFFVQPAGPYEDPGTAYVVMALLAALVALAGTFVAVGLAAADARPDLGTLAAVGADPAVRRRVGAGQAAAIAVPGALVGGAAGLLAGWVLVRFNGGNRAYDGVSHWQLVVPWSTALVVIGVPALAVALGWLTVRSRLEVVRRLGE